MIYAFLALRNGFLTNDTSKRNGFNKWERTRSSGLCKVKVINHIIAAFIQKGELFGYAKILDLFVLQRILFALNTQPGFTKREKKRSLLKSLKIFYVKKMSQ
ncbi:hypothetical protein P8452_25416 [Trifolium repens]|nr:hypothetical protein P8452_25416 [Trifolium repens]